METGLYLTLIGVVGILWFRYIYRSEGAERAAISQLRYYIGWKRPDAKFMVAFNKVFAIGGIVLSGLFIVAGLLAILL